jgi:hypothetical protein
VYARSAPFVHHSKISSEFWLAKVIRGTTASNGIVVFAVSQSAMLTLRISSKGKAVNERLGFGFSFLCRVYRLKCRTQKKRKGEKKVREQCGEQVLC